tara:strand:- start:6947 stop:7207 length:261 start_codon:yes stop_codon:yes gene_type:complete
VEDIFKTITLGINSAHPDSRFAQMPAFGRDEMLDRIQIGMMTSYVQSLSNGFIANDPSEAATLFQEIAQPATAKTPVVSKAPARPT